MSINNEIYIQEKWSKAQNNSKEPTLKPVKHISINDFLYYKDSIDDFIKLITEGHPIIIKSALSKQEVYKIRAYAKQLANYTNSKMFRQKISLQSEDYHSQVVSSNSNFKVKATKHVYNFFRRNINPSSIFSIIEPIWKELKILSAINPYPHTDYIDRLQIVHYPIGGGWLDWHKDAATHQRFIIGCILSEMGQNYSSGGLSFRDSNGEIKIIEYDLGIGDIVLFDPRLEHCVQEINPEIDLTWNLSQGRWFAGMYSMPIISTEN